MKTLAQRIRTLDDQIAPLAGLDRHPAQRNSFEGELSNILCGLRLIMDILLTEGSDEELENEITIYEERVYNLTKKQ